MTLRTNARLAGFTFLFYIANGVASMVKFHLATGGAGAGGLTAEGGGGFLAGATCFAVGSTLYSYHFLRPEHPRPARLAGRVHFGAARDSSYPADGWVPPRTRDQLHLDPDGRVRSDARTVAAYQGSRRAAERRNVCPGSLTRSSGGTTWAH